MTVSATINIPSGNKNVFFFYLIFYFFYFNKAMACDALVIGVSLQKNSPTQHYYILILHNIPPCAMLCSTLVAEHEQASQCLPLFGFPSLMLT